MMAMENTARKMEQQDEFEEQMDADLDAMLDSYMDEDKVEEKYDNMDRAAYDKEQEKLKDAIQQQVEASMAAAPEPAKQAVQESANELYSAMDGVHDAETYFTAEPKTWKDFGTKHLKEMQDAMQEAKSLTRQSLTDARDTVKEGFVDKTAQVVGTMKEAAASIGVHESTVSRAVRDKYLQCAHGVYPMNYFFTGAASRQSNGASVSSDRVKTMLRDIIDSENHNKPYSDRILSEMLARKGIAVSRRTVAKYRESMGIRDASGRKVFDKK